MTDTDGSEVQPSTSLTASVLRHLRMTVAFEIALLVVVVAITAVLVDVTPARAAVATPFSGSASLGDGRAELTVDPARSGRNLMHVFLYDADGEPLEPEGGVTVRMSLPSADMGAIEREPLSVPPGHWTLTTDDLSLAGNWKIEIVADTTRFDREVASFDVPIKP